MDCARPSLREEATAGSGPDTASAKHAKAPPSLAEIRTVFPVKVT